MNNSKLKKKILVVDDDIDILEGLRGRLKHLGYETVTAETGADAIYVLKKESPDVVLLDLALPDKSGLDVLKEIVTLESSFSLQHNQDNDTASYPPVIMLTANGTLESAVEAMKIGAIDFLKKPFEMDHLAVVLEKGFCRKQERETNKNRSTHWTTPRANRTFGRTSAPGSLAFSSGPS